MSQPSEPERPPSTPSTQPARDADLYQPTKSDLLAWAGMTHVTCARSAIIAAWRIPDADKAILTRTGIPVVDQLIEYADIQAEPEPQLPTDDGRLLYRLTRNHHGQKSLTWAFGIEPDTGAVYYVLPDAEPWFAGSSARHWISLLHHYGQHVAASSRLTNPDNYEEEEVLAELRTLAQELKGIDPPAFAGYHGFIWAEFLERWLW
nr:SUKH-4 family immunity protein [Actinospica robiniae]